MLEQQVLQIQQSLSSHPLKLKIVHDKSQDKQFSLVRTPLMSQKEKNTLVKMQEKKATPVKHIEKSKKPTKRNSITNPQELLKKGINDEIDEETENDKDLLGEMKMEIEDNNQEIELKKSPKRKRSLVKEIIENENDKEAVIESPLKIRKIENNSNSNDSNKLKIKKDNNNIKSGRSSSTPTRRSLLREEKNNEQSNIQTSSTTTTTPKTITTTRSKSVSKEETKENKNNKRSRNSLEKKEEEKPVVLPLPPAPVLVESNNNNNNINNNLPPAHPGRRKKNIPTKKESFTSNLIDEVITKQKNEIIEAAKEIQKQTLVQKVSNRIKQLKEENNNNNNNSNNNSSVIKPADILLSTPQVSHKRKRLTSEDNSNNNNNRKNKRNSLNIEKEEERITSSDEIFSNYEDKTVCGILFKIGLKQLYSQYSNQFTKLQYNQKRIKHTISEKEKAGDILLSHLYSFVHGEYCLIKRENREQETAPKLDTLNTKNIKRVHFKRYDFSTVLTPNEGIDGSQDDIIFIVDILAEINEEFSVVRKFLNDYPNNPLHQLFNSLITILGEITESNDYSIDTVNCADYYKQLFIQLLDMNQPRPLSFPFGNYISSLIRYYLRKEFNVYNQTCNSFLTISDIVEMVQMTGTLVFNSEDISSLLSLAFKEYEYGVSLFQNNKESQESLTRREILKEQREFYSAFVFLYSLLTNESVQRLISCNFDNWKKLRHYLELSKTCDDFVDHHFQYLSNPEEFIKTLEDQCDWVENLEGVQRMKNNKYNYNDEFIYPDLTVLDLPSVETMIKASTQKCPVCKKICGANNVVVCDKCEKAYHENCFGSDCSDDDPIMICGRCSKKH